MSLGLQLVGSTCTLANAYSSLAALLSAQSTQAHASTHLSRLYSFVTAHPSGTSRPPPGAISLLTPPASASASADSPALVNARVEANAARTAVEQCKRENEEAFQALVMLSVQKAGGQVVLPAFGQAALVKGSGEIGAPLEGAKGYLAVSRSNECRNQA